MLRTIILRSMALFWVFSSKSHQFRIHAIFFFYQRLYSWLSQEFGLSLRVMCDNNYWTGYNKFLCLCVINLSLFFMDQLFWSLKWVLKSHF